MAAASAAPTNPCPICLDPLKDEAYLDRCFHSFCYKCIIEWSRFLAKKHLQPLSSIQCPLCKTENFSVIHGFTSKSFQRHYVNQYDGKRYLSNAHYLRLQLYETEEHEVTSNIAEVHQYWKRHKYLQKNIWLQTWLSREIQALMQEENVEIIVHHIHGVVESFMKRQEEDGLKVPLERRREEWRSLLCNAARPFLLGHTEKFVDEVELFLSSGLNIAAYDQVWMRRLSESSTSHEASGNDTRPHGHALHNRFLNFVGDDDDDDTKD